MGGLGQDCLLFWMPSLPTREPCPVCCPAATSALIPSQHFAHCIDILLVCHYPVRSSNTVWSLINPSPDHGARKVVDTQ